MFKAIINLYESFFYSIYNFFDITLEIKRPKKDSAIIASILLSILVYGNIFTLYEFINYFTLTNDFFAPHNRDKIAGITLTAINLFYFLYKNRYLKIEERIKLKGHQNKIIFPIYGLFCIASFIIMVFYFNRNYK
jgi:hypothetical protein